LESLDPEIKERINYENENKPNIFTDHLPNVIATMQFIRLIYVNKYEYLNSTNCEVKDTQKHKNKNVIITENNYLENHLDNYFYQANKIIQEENWNKYEPIEIENSKNHQ